MSAEISNSGKKFEEALQLLNEAAREKKDELQGLFSDKYSHIKDFLNETIEKNTTNLNRVRKATEETWAENSERIKEAASELDEQVHKNPWPYLGGVAIGALLLGFILGNSRQR